MDSIALNGRFSGTREPTGTQVASFQLFDAILREAGRRENVQRFVVFADKRFPGAEHWSQLPGVTFVQTPFRDWGKARSHFWEQFLAAPLARRHGCRLMHHPMNTSPAFPGGIDHIVTLHDLNFLLHPEWYSRSFRMVYDICALPGLRKNRCVVTISEYVRGQAENVLRRSPNYLRMIHDGVKPMKVTSPREGNYLFAAGSLQPHKNLARLIEAFLQIKPSYPSLKLIVAGRKQIPFTSSPGLSSLLQSPGVRFTGYLSDEDLANAYAGARAFCFPSLEEGFGLPVLEAMSLGCPVLTSNISCLPEIAGPSLQVDPYSVDAIAGGLRQLLDLAQSEREKLITAGQTWCQRFSWEDSAMKYLTLYRDLSG